MKKVCLILAIILSNAYAVECYDGFKWRDVPSSFLSKLGMDVDDITQFRTRCREAFKAYIEYEKFKERKNNHDDNNEDHDENSSDGIGDGLAGLLGGGGGGIATKANGSIKTPSERDIDMDTGGSRSATDIMKVIRQRNSGLRHIYNKFLKKKPGFQGKVTLKFTIAPGGEIISISIASSTTGYGEFDGEVKNAVSRWKFSKVEAGNSTVTIPFTFSE